MKTLIAISLLFTFSAFADFSDEHMSLCNSPEAKKLMGKSGHCQLVVGGISTNQVSNSCSGKLGDSTCRVMMLKSSDSASMNLLCSDADSQLTTQVLDAQVMSYNVSAVVKTPSGEFKTINDPNDYHILSNPALEVQLSRGIVTKAKMIVTIQDQAIELTDVVCE